MFLNSLYNLFAEFNKKMTSTENSSESLDSIDEDVTDDVEDNLENISDHKSEDNSLSDETTSLEEHHQNSDIVLQQDHIRRGISLLCKTDNGLELAYVKLSVNNMKLTQVNLLETFCYLRYVNLSRNNLTSLHALRNMHQLISLNVALNQLQSLQLHDAPYLQYLNLSDNMISTTRGIKQSSLKILILARNQLEDVCGITNETLPCLQLLDISGNLLKNINNIESETLKNIYMGENPLGSFKGINTLPSLETLHARACPISSLKGLSHHTCPQLKYLNLRGCAIDRAREFRRLSKLQYLSTLVVSDSPITESEGNYRAEILVYIDSLKRIDKDSINHEDLEDAKELNHQRKEMQLNGAVDEADAEGIQETSDLDFADDVGESRA